MVRVAPIKLQVGTKVLWFDPNDNDIHADDRVVVKTERGTEFGTATAEVMEVSDELVANLKSPLKPVLRVATPEDCARAADLAAKGEEALAVFRELAAETSDQMRPVMVEFLFDGDKAVFYFEAEERVDFRDLVRKLASHFHVRVDMRQIGVRDGARIVGGLGHCGQELCCKRLGGEFSPVSIRMAKEQNLSLNPQKISGCCGRLMCCLRYEYDTYKEVNSRAPKHGAKIEVPGGTARVTEVNVPLERVSLLLEDGRTVHIPLDEMEIVGEGKRPNRVSQEVLDRHASPDPLEMLGSSSFEVTHFTGDDKLADPSARSRSRGGDSSREDSHRKPRRRRRSGSGQERKGADKPRSEGSSESKRGKGQAKRQDGQKRSEGQGERGEGRSDARKPRRNNRARQDGQKRSMPRTEEARGSDDKQRSQRRPGQKSSGVRNAPAKADQRDVRQGASAHAAGEVAHRKPRRRRRKAQGEGTDAQQQQQQQ